MFLQSRVLPRLFYWGCIRRLSFPNETYSIRSVWAPSITTPLPAVSHPATAARPCPDSHIPPHVSLSTAFPLRRVAPWKSEGYGGASLHATRHYRRPDADGGRGWSGGEPAGRVQKSPLALEEERKTWSKKSRRKNQKFRHKIKAINPLIMFPLKSHPNFNPL